ncbi:MAG TPA: zf-HC2 domain-containing protein [Candidatus Binatia bacterium]|nr:zf-HC2 domain-containing protein [Candidatus Binatia bacterium]
MTHEELRRLLPAYAAGELDLADAALVQAHLSAGCLACLAEIFDRPIGAAARGRALPPAFPAPEPAPPRHETAMIGAATVAILACLAVWAAHGREVARARELSRATERLSALEAERAHLAERLAAATREITVARAAARPPAAAAVRPPAAAAPRAPEPPPPPPIRYRDDLLSVHVVNMPIDALLAEIARQAGATVRGGPAGRAVSTSFDDVPLPAALSRLLGAGNFSLVYGDGRRLRVVELLGSAAAAGAAEPAPADLLGAAAAALPLIDRHPPITLAGRLARTFSTPTLSLRELIEIGLHHEEREIRGEAIRTSLGAVENDPQLAGLLDAVARMDDATLEQLVRRIAGEHAEEALVQVSTRASRGDLRMKATSVLEKLRASLRAAQG